VALTLYGTAWLASRRGADRLAELLAFAGALAVGAVLLASTESLALLPTNSLPLLFWALAIAVTAIVSSSPITTALGTGVLMIWVFTNSGTPPAPWAFVLVFPSLAIALERRTRPYAAGALTLALGVWVVMVGLDTWQSPFTPGVMALVAGAAIDSWAHLPSHRRPAFASVTPALALVVFGLGLLGVAAIQGAGPPALWGEPAVVLPGMVLVVSLTAIALWPSVVERKARWRSQVFGGLVVVWIGSALAAGGQVPVPAWWYWTWMALPSIALLAVTVTAVREAVTAKNTGLFVVGGAAIVALIGMHFAGDVNRAGQSVAVLFAAAGVLWLVSRTRRLVE
jgi:hypothetical protein